MDAKLVVVGGKANRGEVKLKLPTVIGRGRDAGLTVAHPTVSRQHCEIVEVDGALVVRDNGSTNGTFIGSQRITEAVLRPGDELTVGPLTFRAEYEHVGVFPKLGADDEEMVSDTQELEDAPVATGENELDFTLAFGGSVAEPPEEEFNLNDLAAGSPLGAEAPVEEQAAADDAIADLDDLDFEVNTGVSSNEEGGDTSDFIDASDSLMESVAQATDSPVVDDLEDAISDAPLESVQFMDDLADEPPADVIPEPAAPAAAADDDQLMDFLGGLASSDAVEEAPAESLAEASPEPELEAAPEMAVEEVVEEMLVDFADEPAAEAPVEPMAETPAAAATDDDQLMNFLGGLAESEPVAEAPAEPFVEPPAESELEAAPEMAVEEVVEEMIVDFADETEAEAPVEPMTETPGAAATDDDQLMDFLGGLAESEPVAETPAEPFMEPPAESVLEAAPEMAVEEVVEEMIVDFADEPAAEAPVEPVAEAPPSATASDDDQLMSLLGGLDVSVPAESAPQAAWPNESEVAAEFPPNLAEEFAAEPTPELVDAAESNEPSGDDLDVMSFLEESPEPELPNVETAGLPSTMEEFSPAAADNLVDGLMPPGLVEEVAELPPKSEEVAETTVEAEPSAAADDDQLMDFLGGLAAEEEMPAAPAEASSAPEWNSPAGAAKEEPAGNADAMVVDFLADATESPEAGEVKELHIEAEFSAEAFAPLEDVDAELPAEPVAEEDFAATMQFQGEAASDEPSNDDIAPTMQFQGDPLEDQAPPDDQPDFGFLGGVAEQVNELSADEPFAPAAENAAEADDIGFSFEPARESADADAATLQFEPAAEGGFNLADSPPAMTPLASAPKPTPAAAAKPEKKGFSWWPFGKKKKALPPTPPAARPSMTVPATPLFAAAAPSEPSAEPEPEFDFAAVEARADEPEPEVALHPADAPQDATPEPIPANETSPFANLTPEEVPPAAEPAPAAASSEDEDLNSFFKQMGMK